MRVDQTGHDERPVELDALAAERRIVLRQEVRDPVALHAHHARSRAVLSGRLHGLILAAHAGRPHAGLAYDPKVSGFLADSGAPGFGPPDGADTGLPGALAEVALAAAARAFAYVENHSGVFPDDVQAVFEAVVAHRLKPASNTTFRSAREIARHVLDAVAIP